MWRYLFAEYIMDQNEAKNNKIINFYSKFSKMTSLQKYSFFLQAPLFLDGSPNY